MSFRACWILLLIPILTTQTLGCFPDPPECVGSHPCPDGEIDDEATIDVTHADLELIDETDAAPDTNVLDTDDVDTDEVDTLGLDTLDTTSPAEVDSDAGESPEVDVADTFETAAELPETETEISEVPDTTAEVTPEVEVDVGPEIEPKECDDLDCELTNRECIEGVAATDARCGDCLADFRLDGAQCVAIKRCDDLVCGASNRLCVEATNSSDATCGGCLAGFRLSSNVCVAIVTCNDLGCDAEHRDCLPGAGTADATCGDCLSGYAAVNSDCLATAPAPEGLTASIDRADEVEITWNPVVNAIGYDVYRCDTASCGGGAAGWFVLNDVPVMDLTFTDDTVVTPSDPTAPTNLTATKTDGAKVSLAWDVVSVAAAKSYRYRVVAVSAGGDSPASSSVAGQVANRPITAYELAIDGGNWTSIGVVTTYNDADAPAPTVTAPSVSATNGVHEGYVQLTATGGSAANGATRQYAVRAITALTQGPSASTSGNRQVGALALQWERSAGVNADSFSAINGAIALSYQDMGAPSDGATRWYRMSAIASGATTLYSNLVAGSRLNPASLIPTGVSASTNRTSDVEIRWTSVSGATGYSVYRCDLANCSGTSGWNLLNATATSATSYNDATVAIPSGPTAPVVTATTDRSDSVAVTWATITVADPKTYTYRVVAQSGSGPSTPSSHVVGSAQARPVTGYQVKINDLAWVNIAAAAGTTFNDVTAPQSSVVVPSAGATNGTEVNQVSLTSTGSSIKPGADVTYHIRAITALSDGPSSSAVGHTTATGLQLQWQRSAGTSNSSFSNISGATSANAADTIATGVNTAGATRYYRLQASATGADTVWSPGVIGAVLLKPAGPPGNFKASTNKTDIVELTWDAVTGATQYKISRGGSLLATVGPSPYTDSSLSLPTAWPAPTNVMATGANDKITVTWLAAATPADSSASYSIVASNAAGDGPAANATGKIVPIALVGYTIERTVSGAATTEALGIVLTYSHLDAPAGTITGTPGLMASKGDRRAHVELTANDGAPGVGTAPGTPVTYRVATRVAGGGAGTYSSASTAASRTVGTVSRKWYRSQGTTDDNYDAAVLSTAATFNDIGTPSDGSRRWYKLVLSASGAPDRNFTTSGWRLRFVSIAAGGYLVDQGFTCGLTGIDPDGGRVWCWGSNSVGELGLGSTSTSAQPTRISGLTDVVQIDLGGRFGCARKSTGAVVCWGDNGVGQLGDGTETSRSSPVLISGLSAIDLSAGGSTGCAVNSNNRVQCWGSNYSGQLGNNTTVDSTTPVTVLQSGGSVLNNAIQVSVQGFIIEHGCAVLSDANVWCWGGNPYGGLGRVPNGDEPFAKKVEGISGVTQVSVGGLFTCARISTSGVRCWGGNSVGQLGNNTTVDSTTPVNVSSMPNPTQIASSLNGACGILNGGTSCWGNSPTTSSLTPTNLTVVATGVTALSIGVFHGCALMNNEAYCWGENSRGQLGDGTTADQNTPKKIVGP